MKLFLLLLCLLPGLAFADDWDALDQPGAVAIMRHALAPGTGDPADFDINDCSTQRILNDKGRAQARAIGNALRERGITFDAVLTSQWCRCRETAQLLNLGPVSDAPALNSFFRDRATRSAQTTATRAMIRGFQGPVMMVTHQVNISALTGQFTSSGEILIIRFQGDTIEVLGSILIDP